MSTERALTVEEFERIAPLLDSPSELVDGRLRVMSPTSFLHGVLSARIAAILDRYLETAPVVGEVVGAETGFRIDNPHRPVLAPDAAFISAERVPEEAPGQDDPRLHFMHGAPDLAVEVRSADDTMPEMLAKARLWLEAGAHEVWLIDGQKESVQILRHGKTVRLLAKEETMTSPDLLPGFTLSLGELFARRRPHH